MPAGRKTVLILGIPSCFGGNIKGCELGPASIRKYLIPFLKKMKLSFKDLGDLKVSAQCIIKNPKKKCLPEIKKIYRNFDKTFRDKNIFAKKFLPVLLGGDHSVNFPFIKTAAKNRKLGLLWFDAHGDFNTPRISPSGNIHGMVLSALTGRGLHKVFGLKETAIKERNICLIGVRDLDPKEKKLLARTRITIFSMKEIRRVGLKKVLQKAVKIATAGTQGFHLSFDLDAIDSKIAPGVGTPVKNGLTPAHLKTIATFFRKHPPFSLDVVELYPPKDRQNKTAKLAARFVAALCKK